MLCMLRAGLGRASPGLSGKLMAVCGVSENICFEGTLMSQNRTIIAIGNGPSLRGFDLQSLQNCDTLGMNAAYRHWDRIGWYPTYYCCLDDQLIQTHHAEIKRLVCEELVKGAFVHGSFFELHPECIADDRFWSSDQFHPYWYKRRGATTGRKFIESVAFQTSDTSKVTTGAYAVRFCSYLGYDKIGLIGIDLRYVELLPEAERGEGVALRMTKTPTHNPNYFFDDYQRAGDRYNVPNPDVHQGDLHLRAFRVLRDDFFENSVHSKIVNCNPNSALLDNAIFPFEPLEKLTGASQLGAVIIPCTVKEKDQILANFQLWSQAAFAPFLHATESALPKLVFVFNRAMEDASAEIREKFDHLKLNRYFDSIVIHSLDLDGEADTYSRSYHKPVGTQGYKAGPNNQFFKTMRLASEYGRYVFLMETDCIPIRPGWLQRLSTIVSDSEPFFVMGSAYRGTARLAKSFSRHINGNAIYAAGDPEFISFLDNFWEPELRKAVELADRRLAYDCVLEAILSGAHSDVADDPIWRVWQRIAHKFRYTDFIQNLSAQEDISSANSNLVHDVLRHHPETHILHSQAVARAATNMVASECYLEPMALMSLHKDVSPPLFSEARLEPSGQVQLDGERFLIPTGSTENHLMYRFTGSVNRGDRLVGDLKFELTQPAELSISLCRDGEGPFESYRKILQFAAGTHAVTIEHTFKNKFKGARLQIGAERKPAAFRPISAKLEKDNQLRTRSWRTIAKAVRKLAGKFKQ